MPTYNLTVGITGPYGCGVNVCKACTCLAPGHHGGRRDDAVERGR